MEKMVKLSDHTNLKKKKMDGRRPSDGPTNHILIEPLPSTTNKKYIYDTASGFDLTFSPTITSTSTTWTTNHAALDKTHTHHAYLPPLSRTTAHIETDFAINTGIADSVPPIRPSVPAVVTLYQTIRENQGDNYLRK